MQFIQNNPDLKKRRSIYESIPHELVKDPISLYTSVERNNLALGAAAYDYIISIEFKIEQLRSTVPLPSKEIAELKHEIETVRKFKYDATYHIR